MKTPSITIATTNQSKTQYSKAFINDLCTQIRKKPVPVHSGDIVIGMTSWAKVKFSSRLDVTMELCEELIFKGVKCFFIPICDEVTNIETKGNIIMTGGDLIGISMVKEHPSPDIKPTIFENELGKDFFVFSGDFITSENVMDIIKINKPAYIYYSGDWEEKDAIQDARQKGMMHEKLNFPVSPLFSICHDPPQTTFKDFQNNVIKDIKNGSPKH